MISVLACFAMIALQWRRHKHARQGQQRLPGLQLANMTQTSTVAAFAPPLTQDSRLSTKRAGQNSRNLARQQPGCATSFTPELQLTTSLPDRRMLQRHLPTWHICCLALVPSGPKTQACTAPSNTTLSITSSHTLFTNQLGQTWFSRCPCQCACMTHHWSCLQMPTVASTNRSRHARQLDRGAWKLRPHWTIQAVLRLRALGSKSLRGRCCQAQPVSY